jgi:hypothetical protein
MMPGSAAPAFVSLATAPGTPAPELPEDLPGYRLERVLGRGGMGVVYEATQLTLNRRVAVKLLTPELADDPALRVRFRREALLQAAIDHPHVLDVYETGVCAAGLFIVMRLVRGETLRARLRGGPLSARDAVDLLAPVASALDAAHGCGIVHRDVKPENILIGPQRHAYLADFGLVRARGEELLTRPGIAVGTLGYVPPEQLRGAEPTPAGDVYAFAAVLRECVGPGPLDAVLVRGLAHDPDARPASAGALIAAAGATLRRPPPPTSAPPSSPRPRRRLTAYVAASCALTLCSAVWREWRPLRDARPGAVVAAPLVTAMSAGDYRLQLRGPAPRAPSVTPGVTIQAHVTLRDPPNALLMTCRLADLDTGGVTWSTDVVPIAGATAEPSCWLAVTLVPGDRYVAGMWLWAARRSGAPLAAGSYAFTAGGALDRARAAP